MQNYTTESESLCEVMALRANIAYKGKKIIGHAVLFVIVVWCVKALFRAHERGICVVELQYSSVQI